MQFFLTSALLAVAAASPIVSRSGDASIQQRNRIRCVITGQEGDDISSSAPAGGIVGTMPTGGLGIQCDDGHKWDSGSKLPISQTVKAKDTGFPSDVHWNQEWQTGGYKSCSVSYGDGNPTINGVIGAHDLTLTVGAGSSQSNSCAAEFYVDL